MNYSAIKFLLDNFDHQQDDQSESGLYWEDQNEYIQQYYGEVYQSTTRFDNDYWDDV